jgi:alkanesulfonate monooxygenase SsuD/methylene tetrahydromethanopterin reductase-like flavin-dependent oxidoreductase (luciferase family)
MVGCGSCTYVDSGLRRAVALGDGWHGAQQRPEEPRGTLARLRQEADKAGRPYDTLTLSLRAEAVQGSHRAIVDQYCVFEKLGLNHSVVDFRRSDLSQMLETLDVMVTVIRPAAQAA